MCKPRVSLSLLQLNQNPHWVLNVQTTYEYLALSERRVTRWYPAAARRIEEMVRTAQAGVSEPAMRARLEPFTHRFPPVFDNAWR
jgi:hypothetical protein